MQGRLPFLEDRLRVLRADDDEYVPNFERHGFEEFVDAVLCSPIMKQTTFATVSLKCLANLGRGLGLPNRSTFVEKRTLC